MKSKDIVSIIAFISAFAFSAAFASLFIDESLSTNHKTYEVRSYSSCHYSDQTCRDIQSLLVRDISNGTERSSNYDYSSSENGNVSERRAESVADYADASGSMNDANLPSDFQSAWRAHMQAWRDYSNFLNEVSRSKIDDEKFDRLESRYVRDVNKTWTKVLKVGGTYGASVPYGY